MKSLRKFFSPEALKEVLLSVVRRFPFTFGWLSVLVVWLIVLVIGEFRTSILIESVNWVLTEGVLLSLAAALWCEYLRAQSRSMAVQLIVAIPVLLDFVWLMIHGGVSGDAEYVGRAAVLTALIVAIVFLPAAPGFSRGRLWCYTLNQIGALAAAWLLGIVLAIALGIMFGTLIVLFSFDSWKIFIIAQIIISLYFSSIFYLYKAPLRSDIENLGELPGASPVAAFCKNVLLPGVAAYTIILYIYLAKIIITWSLPTDSISLMVSGLLCVSLVMLYGLRRYTFTPGASAMARRIVELTNRVLPPLLVPLVVLMAVGLIYRIGEYGLTVSRLYVATFTVWAFAVLIYLTLRHEANLNKVAASFALVFVLVSVFPGANMNDIAYRIIRSQVIATLRDAGVDNLPISVDEMKEVISRLPENEGENLASRISYLDDWRDHSLVADIVTSDSKVSHWELKSGNSANSSKDNRIVYHGPVEIPESYTSVKFCSRDTLDCKLNVDSVLQANDSVLSAPIYIQEGDSAMVAITEVDTYYQGTKTRFSFYRFKK